jgi:glycosyltransferase involved in cell wall biosynthesis
MRVLVSVVVPCLNEGRNVHRAYEELTAIFERPDMSDYDLEILFSDNHSSDDTFGRIATISQSDSRVRGVRYSRNVGFQRSILTAYRLCQGDVAVQFDCDCQDPASLIPTFLEHWRQGYKVVYGIRARRQESPVDQLARKFFYRALARVSEDPLPIDAGDFRLIDRRVIEVLKEIRDLHPYLRGAITAIGFNQIGISYERRPRAEGSSKFNFQRNLALATDALVNHSMAPLRMATWIAVILFFSVIITGGALLAARYWMPEDWPRGIALLAGLQLFALTLQAMFFGLLGEYVGRLYRQSKDQWPVVIEDQVGALEVSRGHQGPRRQLSPNDGVAPSQSS